MNYTEFIFEFPGLVNKLTGYRNFSTLVWTEYQYFPADDVLEVSVFNPEPVLEDKQITFQEYLTLIEDLKQQYDRD